MSMPNVLMIGPSLDAMGGMATVENNILKAIRSSGNRVIFLPTYEEGGRAKKLAIAARAYMGFLQEVDKCDLVHVHLASRGSYRRKKIFMEAAVKHGKPILLHLHGSEFAIWYDRECTEEQKVDIRRTFGLCAKIAVLSKEWKDYLLSVDICDAEKIVILHNAVEVPEANNVDYSANTVLFMGRLDDRKSPDTLLRAAVYIIRKFPNARFVFGGDGDIEKYQKLAEGLGIEQACSFIGWTTGIRKSEVFQESSIYCLPSKNEGMPMSILEAMSYGLATVATPVGGIPQIITDGKDGFLFPVDEVGPLVNVLDLLMGNDALKERIGRAGRERIQSAFSLDAFAKNLINVYKEIY